PAFHPFRIDELECDRTPQRGINCAIRHSHGAAPAFPQRSVVSSLNAVISESTRDGRKRGLVRFFCALKSNAQQANHAAPEIAGESSLQPRPALRTNSSASRLCLHYSAACTSLRCRSSASTSAAFAKVQPASSRIFTRYLARNLATTLCHQ